MKATAKDLRFHSKEILDTVARGEEVIITFRGKPQARIVPYRSDMEKTEESVLFGIWKNNNVGDIGKYVRYIRKGRNQ